MTSSTSGPKSRAYIALRRVARGLLKDNALLDRVLGDRLRRLEKRLGLVRRVIPEGPGVVRVHGFDLGYRSNDMGVAAPLVFYGDYDPETRQALEDELQLGGTFVDLGAHIGYFSLLGARCVGPAGRVFAFEPTPGTRQQLLENLQRNGVTWVEVSPCAVTESVGEACYRSFPGASESNGIPPGGEAGTLRVPTTSLDAFVAERGWPPVDLVKIDVEGAELRALRGMREVSQRNPRLTVIFEVLLAHFKTHGTSLEALVAELRALGFTHFEVLTRARPGPIELPAKLNELKELAQRCNLNILASKASRQ